MIAPLYQSLASDLRAAIARGDYPPGAHLPTEYELCAREGVSRHTAREALRILTQEGLIERRRGAGTIVTQRGKPRPFVQTIGDLSDILQYARSAQLTITAMAQAGSGGRDRALLELEGESWMRVEGFRGPPTRPIAWTRVLIRGDVAPARREIEAFDGAINELIATQSGVRAARITQTIASVALSDADARRLTADAGAPALRTVRRYLDAEGRIFQGSVSLHPGDRFEYDMKLERRHR
jgi:DNA-binding GntR family transcriptional regulator